MATPALTLITPVLDGAATIEQTIASVRAQFTGTGRVAELQYVVVDGLSSDGTEAIVGRHRDLVSDYLREADDGLYHAMNKGIARARGEIVGILNADDMLEPGALAQVCRAFEDPALDYVCSDARLVDANGRETGLYPVRTDWLDGRRSLLGRDWRFTMGLPHPTLFVRRSIYEELGAFDLGFRLAADHEFVCRLIAHRKRGRRLETPLARFRTGGLSLRNLSKCFLEDERIARRYGVHPWLARAIRWRKTSYAARRAAAGSRSATA